MVEANKSTSDNKTTPAKSTSDSALRNEVRKLRDVVEDLCDHVYGVNVRPLARERSDDEYAAVVVPTSADEGTEQFEKDVKR